MKPPSPEALVRELENQLRRALALHEAGAGPELREIHAEIDACMRELLSHGFATQQELLQLVASERTRARGPATLTWSVDAHERVVDARPSSAERLRARSSIPARLSPSPA